MSNVSEQEAASKVDDALKAIIAGAHDLIEAIDKQTYDEWKRHDWDAPDDCEFHLVLTAKQLVVLDKILSAYTRAADRGRDVLAQSHRSKQQSGAEET